MKKNFKKIFKKGSVLILLGTLILGGGVFAKYVTSINGSESMAVAKWNVNLEQIQLSNTHYTAESLTEGEIAPGTKGSFNVVVDATGTETGVDYAVTFSNVTNMPKNMYFVVDETEYATLDEVASAISGHINPGDSTKKIEKIVEWKWDYQTEASKDGLRTTLAENDIQDTNDGKAAKTMSFNVIVTATQSRPVEAN